MLDLVVAEVEHRLSISLQEYCSPPMSDYVPLCWPIFNTTIE